MQRPDPYSLLDTLTIGHNLFERSKQRILREIKHADGVKSRRSYALLGPSGTGKTKLALECIAHLPAATRESEGMHVPKLFTKVPAKPTPKSLASALLMELGDPRYTRGAEWELLARVHLQMRRARVRALVLDDIHHFVDQATPFAVHHVADMLKNIIDEVKCVIIVTGLPYTTNILHTNEQVRRRFGRPVALDRFFWDKAADREEFLDILTSFEAAMKTCFRLPNLGSESMGFRFYCASGGIIGYVAKILDYAAQNAADENRSTLAMSDFDVAYQEAVWEPDSMFPNSSPFVGTRPLEPTADLLHAIQKIGEPGQPEQRRGPNRNGNKQVSVASVLVRK